jgi:hypothetical protein
MGVINGEMTCFSSAVNLVLVEISFLKYVNFLDKSGLFKEEKLIFTRNQISRSALYHMSNYFGCYLKAFSINQSKCSGFLKFLQKFFCKSLKNCSKTVFQNFHIEYFVFQEFEKLFKCSDVTYLFIH